MTPEDRQRLLDEEAQRKAEATNNVAMTGRNPSIVARSNRLAKVFGVEPQLVEADPVPFEQQLEREKVDAVVTASPWMVPTLASNPNLAATFKADDLARTGDILAGFGMAKPKPEYLGAAPRGALPTTGRMGERKEATPWTHRNLVPRLVAAPVVAFGEAATRMAQGVMGVVEAGVDVAGFNEETEAFFRREQETGNRILANMRPEWLATGLASDIQSGVASTMQMLMPLPFGKAAVLPVLAGATFGEAYTRYQGRDAGVAASLFGGVAEGAIEYATERSPLKYVFGGLKGGKSAFTRYVRQELVGEQIATAGQDAVDTLIANPDKTWADYWNERPAAAMSTLVSTLTTSALVGGGGALYRRFGQTVDAARDSNEALLGQTLLDDAMTKAAVVEARANSPEEFARFVAEGAANTPVRNVYIPVEAIDAAMADETLPEEEKAALRFYQDQIEEARLNNGEVVIPIGDALASFAGTKVWQSLKDDARVLAGGISGREAREKMGALTEELEAIGNAAMEEAQAAAPQVVAKAEVYNEVKAQMVAAGRSEKEAQTTAVLMASRAETLATERYGQFATPQDAWKWMQLQIVGPKAKVGKAVKMQQPSLLQAAKTPDVEIKLEEGPAPNMAQDAGRTTWLEWIESKRKGAGTEAMTKLVAEADRQGRSLALNVDETAEDQPRLRRFYERFGFRADPVGGPEMVREPSQDGFPVEDVLSSEGDGTTAYQQSEVAFYSAAERVVEQAKQEKATAAQWKALLTPGKTPGIKSEEIEWTGIHDWLDMQQGQIEKGPLLQVLRDRGIKVEEVVLGDIAPLREQGILRIMEDLPGTSRGEAAAIWDEDTDQQFEVREAGLDTQFKSWSSDPSNDSYRELLITLPIGQGGNPSRAPSTHWDTESVVAHARFMDKTDAEGKRVLFIEEVQSDWHQKGRDEGYNEGVDPAVLAERAAEEEEATAKANAAGQALISYIKEAHQDGDPRTTEDTPAFALANYLADVMHRLPPERQTPARLAMEKWRALDLRYQEAAAAHNRAKHPEGIPEAPFKSSWPALVMKRMIRYAAENGYERVAWTTGKEQSERYNLSQAVGDIVAFKTDDGRYALRFSGDSVHDTLISNGIAEDDGEGRTLMTAAQMKEAFGSDVATKIVEQSETVKYVKLDGSDLNVGGEGMRAFYDRNLVNITNDIIKKYGAKVGPVVLDTGSPDDLQAIEGSRIRRANVEGLEPSDYRTEALAREDKFMAGLEGRLTRTNPGFDITDKMRDAAMGGFTLFQGPRGEATFFPSGKTVIQLFGRADFSTMLHEMSHVFLQQEFLLSRSDAASPALKADIAALTKWFEANGGALDADGMPNREAHELFARTGERYFREGKAPSAELRGAFTQFRTWLKAIYTSVTQIGNAPINPEIREIMGRMIATDEAIDANATAPMSNDALGMTTAEYAAYLDSVQSARDTAHDTLLERMMKAIRRREQTKMREQRANVRAEVAEQVNSDPRFVALHLLRTGRWLGQPEREALPIKIHTGWLIDNYGEEVLGALPVGLQPLHRGDGVVGDDIAEIIGMPSGDALVRALLDLKVQADQLKAEGNPRPLRDEIIETQTDAIMAERHGDIVTEAQIEEEAIAALNSNRQGEVLATELRQLKKLRSAGVVTPYQLLREWARRKVNEGTVADAVSKTALQRYIRAYNKARNAFENALLDKNPDEAIKQKQAQMINHALLAEGKVVADEINVIVRRMQRYARTKALASIDQDYMDRIHELLEGYSFRDLSDRQRAEQASFETWAAAQEGEVHVPARFRDDRVNWKDARVAKLLELNDMVQSLVHLGKLKQKLITAGEERDLQEALDEGRANILALPPRTQPEASIGQANRPFRQAVREAKTFGEHATAVTNLFSRSTIREGVTGLLKMEGLADRLDGTKAGNGVWNRVLIRGATEAQNLYSSLMDEVANPLHEAMRGLNSRQRRRLRDHITIDELTLNVSIDEADVEKLGKPWSGPRLQLLGMILNTGSVSNFAKMLGGERWGDPESAADMARVRDILVSYASKEDMDLVQSLWTGAGKLWPHIARVERELSGVVPEEVVPVGFDTPYGPYTGGYWPVVWDSTRSEMGRRQTEEEATGMMGTGFGIATPKGHTITRTAAMAPLDYNLDVVLNNHLNKVISRIAYAPWVRDALKFADNRMITGAIRLRLGNEYVSMIKPWIRDQIPSNNPDIVGAKLWEKAFDQARINMSIAVLGVSYSTGVAQTLGLGYSAGVLGEGSVAAGGKWVALGIARTLQLQKQGGITFSGQGLGGKVPELHGAQEFVFARSEEMQRRAHEINQESAEVFRRLRDADTPWRKAQAAAFWHIGFIDLNMVAIPTWMGGYTKGITPVAQGGYGLDDADASAYADKMVRLSQSSGRKKDLSAIQRGGAFQKMLAMFYTPSSAFFNQQWEAAQHIKDGGKAGWSKALAPTFWFLVMTTIMDAMREGDWPEDDDEDGTGAMDVAEWIGRNAAFGMFYAIPGVRDAANTTERQMRGEYAEYGNTPLSFGFQTVGKAISATRKQIEGEETTGKMLKDQVAATGFLLGLPGNQPGKSAGYIKDVYDGRIQPEDFGDWYSGLTSGKQPESKE